MADKTTKARSRAAGGAGRASKQAKGAAKKSKRTLKQEAQAAGVRAILREVPYASLGLGRVVGDAVRDVDAASLPERLRKTPAAVVSKVSKQGPNVKVGYLALAARGRGDRLKSAGQEAADDAAEGTKGAAKRAKAAGSGTKAKKGRA